MQDILLSETSKYTGSILAPNYGNESTYSNVTAMPRYNTTTSSTDWGPVRDPLTIVIPITIIYLITFITGFIGNISTCIVIARNKSMHTATNYYLFSLAISDLLLLVTGLPPEIYSVWSKFPYIFGEPFCVLQGFAAETSANATVLTITAFTVERYVAICHPFVAHTLSKLSRAVKLIMAIWIIALCLAIPPAMSFGIIYQNGNVSNHCVCAVVRTWVPHAFEISTCVFFFAPMFLITVLYVLIGLQLHRSTVGPSRGNSVKLKHRVYKPPATYANSPAQAVLFLNDEETVEKLQNDQDDEGRKNFAKNAQATKHVVKMLIAVVVAFFICWAPFHAQRLFAVYGEHSSTRSITAYQTLTYISGVFYYLSTTVNPLLYHIMSHKFREAFKSTFKHFFRRGRNNPGGRCYATLSGRSSQVNSHSNTDSYSRQSSLRYLDVEMARVHDSRRPLVVSFRRKTSSTSSTTTSHHRRRKQFESGDDLQKILHSLNGARDRNGFLGSRSGKDKKISILEENHDGEPMNVANTECSFVEVHNLQPTHICPLTATELPSLESLKLENMEIFQEKLMNLQKSQCSASQSKSPFDNNLCKSCTMPDIGKASFHNMDIQKRNQNRIKYVSISSNIDKPNSEYECISRIISSQYSDSIAIHVNQKVLV